MGNALPIALGILASLAACIACAVLVAVSIAIVDIYLAGQDRHRCREDFARLRRTAG